MTPEKLKEVLDKHALWIKGVGGERADLRNANLSNADLRNADLRYADLRYANLSNANLSYADLRNADLRYANLRNADLRNANLRYANLSYANLRYANLRYANLCNADLRNADLDYSCWPLWCGSTNIKADEAIVGQLLFHAFELAKSSGVEIKSLDDVRMLIDKGSPITRHGLKNPVEGK